MAGGRDETMPGGVGTVETRLSPAEVREVMRGRLERMGLRPAEVHHLAAGMQSRLYRAGEIIVPRGTRADCLGLVVRGQVAVHVGTRGAGRLVVVLLPGSTFGEAMLSAGRPSHATLQALTRCEVRFLRRADLEAWRRERRAARQAASLARLVRAGAGVLLLLILALWLLNQPGARRALALAPMAVGQWAGQRGYDAWATESWQIAANLAPADANALLALGNLYFAQDDVAAAEQAFEQARDLAPNLPEVYNNLGLIYARQGNHRRAVAAFRRALELEPGIAAVEQNLALSLQALEEYDQALAHYELAVALGEPAPDLLASMAAAYYEAGQPAEAVRAAEQALEADEALALAHTVLGAVALEARRPEEALAALQRAVALDAGQPQASFFLGLAYKALGRPAEAIAAFERALASANDEATRGRIRRHLQELYRAQESSDSH